MEDPRVVWLPSIGVTGMTFYTGDRFPHWKRNVFVAGLREGGIPRTGQIQRIVFNDRLDAALCAVFIFVVLSVLVYTVKTSLAARAANRPTTRETPFEPAPSGAAS